MVPSHYLDQCWVIFNWTFKNKLQWNFNQNTRLFIHKNASENTVCEMTSILSRGRWVKCLKNEVLISYQWNLCRPVNMKIVDAVLQMLCITSIDMMNSIMWYLALPQCPTYWWLTRWTIAKLITDMQLHKVQHHNTRLCLCRWKNPCFWG